MLPRTWLHFRIAPGRRLGLNALCFLSLAAALPAPLVAQEISNDWQFAASLYGWFPDIGGHTEFPVRGSDTIGVDIGTILDHLKMTAQGSFAIQKGPWGAFTDVVYLDVGASRTQTRDVSIDGHPLPAGVTAATHFDLKTTIWTLAGNYRVVASPVVTADLLAGARLAALEQTLEWQFSGNIGSITPPARAGSRNTSVHEWDAIVGVKGRFAFGSDRKWAVPYYLDVGTGDSDFTWQGVLGLSYGFHWGDVSLVWRYLSYDLKSNAAIADMNFSGPALGATFRW